MLPNSELIVKLLVNSDDQIKILLPHIKINEFDLFLSQIDNDDEIPLKQYIILQDNTLDLERTFADYDICESTTLFYTQNENSIALGFLNNSVFYRDFYCGGTKDYYFASRNKFATVPPTNCQFCPNPVYMTIIHETPHYGVVCRKHVPHIPLHFHHMGIEFIDHHTRRNYKFNSEMNKWIQLVCRICAKSVYDFHHDKTDCTDERDICKGHVIHPVCNIFQKSIHYVN